MKSTLFKIGSLLVLVGVIIFSYNIKSEAVQITLDFEGVGNNSPVLDYYDGGAGGPANDFGISFSSNTYAFVDSDNGGSGDFGGEPSGNTAIASYDYGPIIINVWDGFEDEFSFFYSSLWNTGTIYIFDGLSGGGSQLASMPFSTTPYNGAPDPTGTFSPFEQTSLSFNGIAKSVGFFPDTGWIYQNGWYYGEYLQMYADNMTFGAAESVPAPASLLLLGIGLVGMGGLTARKRFKTQEITNK